MHYLNPPKFSNPDIQRQANLVHLLTLIVIITVSIFGLVMWLFVPEQRDRIPLVAGVVSVGLIVYWLNFKGKVVAAGWVYITGMWFVFTAGAFSNGGVRSPAYIAYIVGILLAGVLINLRAAILFSLLSMGAGFVMVVGMGNGSIVGLPPAVAIWVAVSLLYFFIIGLTYYATHNINQALVKARSELEERRRAEASLFQSEARYKQLLEDVWDVVYTLSVDGRILSLNPAFEDLTGYAVDEWIGKPFLPLFSPLDHEYILRRTKEIFNGRVNFPSVEYRVIKKNKDVILVEFASSLMNDNGELKLMGIARDVTEKRKMEDALQQAQKLDSLGMMAGGIAHDFNNLLVGMLAQTSLAERMLPDDSPVQKPVKKAVQAAERAADLTRQLLAYSGQGEFEIRPLNLNQLIQENLHIFEVAIAKHIVIVADFYEPLPMIKADRGQIQQIVMNLLLNGGQAIGKQNGKITITTRPYELAENDDTFSRLTGRPLPVGSYILFSVEDEGKGMDQEMMSHIFDPFYSTKEGGYGLGLAAVLGIVRGHYGGLEVKSEVGQGTIFQLLFPQMNETVARETAVTISDLELASKKKGTVLVIDDEAPVREAIGDILAMENILVMTAENGQAGIELFSDHQDEIDLILLDLSMPGLSGAETLVLLREKSSEVKIILTSGYVVEDVKLHQQLADDFLSKPYNLDQLVTKVQTYL